MSRKLDVLRSLVSSGPFQVCDQTQTLYLPIRHPSLTLSLTIPSAHDVPNILECMNDESVTFQLSNPPYPYLEENALERLNRNLLKYDTIVNEWVERGRIEACENCPVSSIRLGEGATGKWVGEIGFSRVTFEWLRDEELKERMKKENLMREIGDPKIVYGVGFFVRPSYQKQGIMPAALGTLIRSYLIPIMNARRVHSSVYIGNWASRKAQEKCGFRVIEDGDWEHQVTESRGGIRRKLWRLEYALD